MTKKEIREMMDLKDSGNMAISDLVSSGGPEIQVDKPNIQEPKVIWRWDEPYLVKMEEEEEQQQADKRSFHTHNFSITTHDPIFATLHCTTMWLKKRDRVGDICCNLNAR